MVHASLQRRRPDRLVVTTAAHRQQPDVDQLLNLGGGEFDLYLAVPAGVADAARESIDRSVAAAGQLPLELAGHLLAAARVLITGARGRR